MSPLFYTVAEVAVIFSVTAQAVRDWIRKGQLIAIQPSGENGVYRIPAPAVDAMRRRRGELPRILAREGSPTPERAASRDLYVATIKPALDRSRSTRRNCCAEPRMAMRRPSPSSATMPRTLPGWLTSWSLPASDLRGDEHWRLRRTSGEPGTVRYHP